VKARAKSIEGLFAAARSIVKNNLLNIMTQATDTDKTILDAIDKLDHKIDTFNEKFDNYQKASQSIVNLAFGLIASATIVTLAQTIFRR
jgi:hypothetical protein